jgi:iron complex outermembrane receptor protein
MLKSMTFRSTLAAVACAVSFSVHAMADSSPKKVEIAAGDLRPALLQLSRTFGVELLYQPGQLDHFHTAGAKGTYTPEAAVRILLKGTPLELRTDPSGAMMVIDPKAPHAAAVSALSEQGSPAPGSSDASQSRSGLQLAQTTPGATSTATAPVVVTRETNGRVEQLQEVIVTAQKRTETVNTTPIAVTALDMTQLEDAGVYAVKDLTSVVPNLQIHTIGVDDFVGITIRGISNLSYVPAGNPAVSTYIDGVYVDQPVGFADEIYDLQRVEVLRGPQGTLYGRNATGGNLNIITADPKSSFDSAADVSYGNYNDVMTHAMVNVPVSDTLAIRAAFMQHRNDGYFDSEGTTNRNYGAAADMAARITGLWSPTDRFKWRLSFDGFVSNGTPGASIATGADQKPIDGGSPYHQPWDPDPEPDNYIQNAAVRSRMDFRVSDNLTLTYVAGYQHVSWYYYWATTGQEGLPAAPAALKVYSAYQAHSQSDEVDLTYDTARLKNVFGATYFDQPVDEYGYALYPIYGLAAGPGGQGVQKRSWGVFDQATYAVLDKLRLTAGVRYSHDFQSQSATDVAFCAATPDSTLAQSRTLTAGSPGCFNSPGSNASGSWSRVSWKGGIEYDVSDSTLTYASVTTGYKQGGVQNGVSAGLPTTFRPETVTSYEAGMKLRLLDRSLNIRIAGFYEDYQNLQVVQFLTLEDKLELLTTNAASSGIYGAEIESEWKVTPRDNASAFFTYLHARYGIYNNAVDPLDSSIIPSLAGSQLPNAPEFSLRLQYSHDFPLPNGAALSPLAAVYWQSTSYSEPVNIPVYKIAAYSKTDLQLTYTSTGGKWRAAAYVDNLEDHAVRNSDYSSGGIVFSDFNAPRTYGLRVSYQF